MNLDTIHTGDCLEWLKTLPENSVDACVTDPPAGIGFMGKTWDHDKGGRDKWIAWLSEVMAEVLRVLKPGGHAFVWALPRTSHWTGMALEDAGFEVRDSVCHVFGSGFPKALDVSKAIDKAASAEREVVGVSNPHYDGHDRSVSNGRPRIESVSFPSHEGNAGRITAPATEPAQQWAGWRSAIKPAHEVWWLCRKPLSEKTIAANVVEHGTGALNIDATRVAVPGDDFKGKGGGGCHSIGAPLQNSVYEGGFIRADIAHTQGRYPANFVLSHSDGCRRVGTKRVVTHGHYPSARGEGSEVCGPAGHKGQTNLPERGARDADGKETVAAWECVDGCPVKLMGEQSGDLDPAGNLVQSKRGYVGNVFHVSREHPFALDRMLKDTGTAARFFQQFEPEPFFYCAKASRRERTEGLREGGQPVTAHGARPRDWETADWKARNGNHHPTVKPLALMRYLVRMITPPDGTVIDPFAGSGTTCVAAWEEGFHFLACDEKPEYVEIARGRIKHARDKLGLFAESPQPGRMNSP